MAFPSFLWISPPFVYSPGWRICFWRRGNLLFLFKKCLTNSSANHLSRPFQNVEFDPPSLDRKGRPIDYQPPCPVLRMWSTAPSLKKLMKTHATSTIVMYQSSKRKAAQGITQKTTTRKRLCRTRPSAAQVNNSPSSQNDTPLLISFLHSYRALCPNLLWVRNCYPRRSTQHQLNLHRLTHERSRFWLK